MKEQNNSLTFLNLQFGAKNVSEFQLKQAIEWIAK
jgi:hypothetical protein